MHTRAWLRSQEVELILGLHIGRETRCGCEKIVQNIVQPICHEIMNNFYHAKSSQKLGLLLYIIIIKMPKGNNRPEAKKFGTFVATYFSVVTLK
jgi:hypothetical protein